MIKRMREGEDYTIIYGAPRAVMGLTEGTTDFKEWLITIKGGLFDRVTGHFRQFGMSEDMTILNYDFRTKYVPRVTRELVESRSDVREEWDATIRAILLDIIYNNNINRDTAKYVDEPTEVNKPIKRK